MRDYEDYMEEIISILLRGDQTTASDILVKLIKDDFPFKMIEQFFEDSLKQIIRNGETGLVSSTQVCNANIIHDDLFDLIEKFLPQYIFHPRCKSTMSGDKVTSLKK